MVEETLSVDPKTGGMKGMKLERHDLIPFSFIRALAQHYGLGAMKYEDNNWRKGYRWSLSYAALQRHLHEWLSGATYYREKEWPKDEYSHHLVAAAWHCICLWWFQDEGVGGNDLVKRGGTVWVSEQPERIAVFKKAKVGDPFFVDTSTPIVSTSKKIDHDSPDRPEDPEESGQPSF